MIVEEKIKDAVLCRVHLDVGSPHYSAEWLLVSKRLPRGLRWLYRFGWPCCATEIKGLIIADSALAVAHEFGAWIKSQQGTIRAKTAVKSVVKILKRFGFVEMERKMKKLSIIIASILIAATAQASPWLVCDPQPGITGYMWSMDGGPWTETAYELFDATCAKVRDLADIQTGQHNIQVKAFKIDEVWGRLESDPAPFDFAKPAVGRNTNMGLKK